MGLEKFPVLVQADTELQEPPPARGEGVFQPQLLNPRLLRAGDQRKASQP